MGVEFQTQAQSTKIVKKDNAVVYVREENGITVVEAFSRRKTMPYEIWVLHRDEKIKKLLHKYHEALDKYIEIDVQIKAFTKTIRRLKLILRRMRKQDEKLHEWFIVRLENEIEMLKDIREGLKLKAKEVKAQVDAMRKRFEHMRKIAMRQFEEFEPMHALPISDWKKRIEMIVEALKAYEKNMDINNLVTFKKLITQKPWRNGRYARIKMREIEKANDYYVYINWLEFLNELALEVFEDMLQWCLVRDANRDLNICVDFKKPSVVKLLQAYMDNVDWNGIMKAVDMWLKTKP
jgi:hypothetical protein